MTALRLARLLTGLYFTTALVFVTWPGLVPFARARPFVLGLPFAMAWIAAWVAGAVVVLVLLDRVERRHRSDEPRHRSDGSSGPAGGPR